MLMILGLQPAFTKLTIDDEFICANPFNQCYLCAFFTAKDAKVLRKVRKKNNFQFSYRLAALEQRIVNSKKKLYLCKKFFQRGLMHFGSLWKIKLKNDF